MRNNCLLIHMCLNAGSDKDNTPSVGPSPDNHDRNVPMIGSSCCKATISSKSSSGRRHDLTRSKGDRHHIIYIFRKFCPLAMHPCGMTASLAWKRAKRNANIDRATVIWVRHPGQGICITMTLSRSVHNLHVILAELLKPRGKLALRFLETG